MTVATTTVRLFATAVFRRANSTSGTPACGCKVSTGSAKMAPELDKESVTAQLVCR